MPNIDIMRPRRGNITKAEPRGVPRIMGEDLGPVGPLTEGRYGNG